MPQPQFACEQCFERIVKRNECKAKLGLGPRESYPSFPRYTGECDEAESELKTFLPESGVPRADMLELLRGPPDVLLAVWTYWKTKRENDKEGLPILSRLRQEAIQMAARKARWWSTVTDMQRLHSHLKQARARRCSVLGQQCGLSPIHMPPPARPGSCISCSRTSNLARGSSGK